MHFAVCSYHVTYTFRSESTLYSCLNVKEYLARSGTKSEFWVTGNYRAWIHFKTRTWHDKNMQLNTPYRLVLTAQLNHLISLLNGWVFVYELSGCGCESSCIHLSFKFRPCFEQGVPWHSGNYTVRIHSQVCTWHDKNI